MASDRIGPAQPGPTLRTAGSALISIVLWSLTGGNIFADSIEKVRDAKAAKAALLGVPLSFEANRGQTDSRVKFLSRGDGYALFLTSQEAVFTLRPPAGAKAPRSVVRMELKGANREAELTGADKLQGVTNYYIGNDPKKWRHTTIGRAASVRHRRWSGAISEWTAISSRSSGRAATLYWHRTGHDDRNLRPHDDESRG